jgi:hypothetical protein
METKMRRRVLTILGALLVAAPRAKWKQPPREERVTAKGGNCAHTGDEAPMCRKMDGVP